MVPSLVNAPLMVLVGYKKDAEEDNKRAAITHLGLSLQTFD